MKSVLAERALEKVEKRSPRPLSDGVRGRSEEYWKWLLPSSALGSSPPCPLPLFSDLGTFSLAGRGEYSLAPSVLRELVTQWRGSLQGGIWGLLRKEGVALRGLEGRAGASPAQKIPLLPDTSTPWPLSLDSFLFLCLHLPELSQQGPWCAPGGFRPSPAAGGG